MSKPHEFAVGDVVWLTVVEHFGVVRKVNVGGEGHYFIEVWGNDTWGTTYTKDLCRAISTFAGLVALPFE